MNVDVLKGEQPRAEGAWIPNPSSSQQVAAMNSGGTFPSFQKCSLQEKARAGALCGIALALQISSQTSSVHGVERQIGVL